MPILILEQGPHLLHQVHARTSDLTAYTFTDDLDHAVLNLVHPRVEKIAHRAGTGLARLPLAAALEHLLSLLGPEAVRAGVDPEELQRLRRGRDDHHQVLRLRRLPP